VEQGTGDGETQAVIDRREHGEQRERTTKKRDVANERG
jgi:hypothetical protein